MNINKFLHGPNVAGQSLVDRVMAAKHSLTGEGLAKSVGKATTEEPMPPKKKHIDYLLQCTHEPNVSVPQLAGLLLERSQNEIWIVVFKSLITTHTLMNYGNERFMQYLASNNCSFHLDGFMDKGSPQGYDMSPFVWRYAKYLNAKAFSYRQMAYDFCKIKKGKDDGVLRVMETDKLLKAVPVLQSQVDALLEFDCTRNDLNNSVINASFMMLFKDLIRLLACYNDGIINLLAKFFEMSRKQCKEGLDIYKKFVSSMELVAKFLGVAESVGIDKGDIPDLAKAPSSLMDTLEAHVKSMESSKKGGAKGPSAAVASAISDLTAAATHNGDHQNLFFDESTAAVTVSSNNPFADVLQPADDNGGQAADLTFDLFAPTSLGGEAASGNNPFFSAGIADAESEGTEGSAGGGFVITQDDPWSSDGIGQSHAGGFASDDAFAAAFGSGSDRVSSPSFDPGNSDASLALFADNLNISASPKTQTTSEPDILSNPTSTTVTSGAGQDDDSDPFADLR